ncbi:hypothetical protein [Liquorilactobacillus mali]|uniref:hypothetical protein n=1 Tax=Liquorilactobacillus mali TaxID=1618 RepID=UPI00234FE296|nr:hypothetical protein [Liquorilactobacillus mali]MDC7953993.1 hypothetical protein [Liquorilactobacillus mali]
MKKSGGYVIFSALTLLMIMGLIFSAQMYYYYIRSSALKKMIDFKTAEILVNLAKTNNIEKNGVIEFYDGIVKKNSDGFIVNLKSGEKITIMIDESED